MNEVPVEPEMNEVASSEGPSAIHRGFQMNEVVMKEGIKSSQ